MTKPFSPNNPAHTTFLDQFTSHTADALHHQNQAVSESLNRRQIPSSQIRPLEEAYHVSLKLGDNLPLNPIKKQILQQLDAVVYFLRDFHIGILGQRTSIFHLYDVEIQVESHLRYQVTFESGKLLIQIPYWQMAVLDRYLPYQKLKYYWRRGKHLPRFSPIRKIWWLVDPIGELRYNLRSMLVLAIQKQILGIDKLFVKFNLLDNGNQKHRAVQGDNQNQTELKNHAIAFLKATVKEEKLGVNLDLVLENQDDATIAQLLAVYKKNLADIDQMEELIETGTFTLQEKLNEEQSQVDIKMFGFVNVGNYHRIDVAVNLSKDYLKKYVDVIPRKTDIKAVQFGFVNVYTIDDITVKPNFHGALTLNFETAALERALKELELVQ
ncbi:MAG: hypothetical protein RH949_21955 [Coleofasciculus sp. A1-SPW-01]|uniref:hypothetical protein n=1 Tax=Coleofasciculus sp. A1-SPW-01 TaxID=3070819 RepID=UPI0032FF49FF